MSYWSPQCLNIGDGEKGSKNMFWRFKSYENFVLRLTDSRFFSVNVKESQLVRTGIMVILGLSF